MGLLSWWRRKFAKDQKTVNDEEIIAAYRLNGAIFGDAVSYIYMGECVGFEELLAKWEACEVAYANLGFRTLSLDDFVDHGGYGKDIDSLLRVPRKVGEEPVLHAKYYREHFLGKCSPAIDFNKMFEDGQPQFGNYARPSTAHLKDE